MELEQRIFRGSPHYRERVRNERLGQNELNFLSINMPPECNYNCVGCLSRGNNSASSDSLSIEEIQGVINQAGELGARSIEISGEGEPLMNASTLEETIRYANSQGMATTLFTNGSLLTRNFINFLANSNVSLAISLEYFNREDYERYVCRRNTFEGVMRNIEYARDIYSELIENENGYRVMPFAIHSIVDAPSRTEIPRIRAFCGDDIYHSIAPIANVGTAPNHPELNITDEESSQIINDYSDGSIILSDNSATEIGFPVCGTFIYGLGITHEGEALFDAHAYDTRGILGNVRDVPLRDLRRQQRELVNLFYNQFGSSFCPLRDPNYRNFVQHLRHEFGGQND